MVNKKKDTTTEEKILAAARKVFMTKSLAGARMQDIADQAGINKAMLHYYFRSKEKLFEVIFLEGVQKLFSRVNFIFDADLPLFEKIEQFVEDYISIVQESPYLPSFVLHEINQDPEGFFEKMGKTTGFPKPFKFLEQLEQEVKKGTIKKINPIQLLMNMISLCIFPFMMKPVLQLRMGIDDTQYQQLLEQRKKEVSKFIIDAIKK